MFYELNGGKRLVAEDLRKYNWTDVYPVGQSGEPPPTREMDELSSDHMDHSSKLDATPMHTTNLGER